MASPRACGVNHGKAFLGSTRHPQETMPIDRFGGDREYQATCQNSSPSAQTQEGTAQDASAIPATSHSLTRDGGRLPSGAAS